MPSQSNTPRPGTPTAGTTALPNKGGGTSVTSPVKTPQTTINFLANILDNYDAYTYHFKLFITSVENAAAGTVLTPANQVVIAESGVSDITIDKIEMNGIAVPSVEAGTGTQTTIKFEIIEPAGAGLLDKMFYEAVSLGIGNWLVMPCYLQLYFRARDPVDGDAVTSGAPGLGSLTWVWPVKLTNVKANVTNVGTKYEFETIMYDELAQSNAYFSVQHSITLNNVSNFASAMVDLERKLNEDQFEKLFTNYSIPDTYKIYVDPILANNVTALVADENKNSSRGGDYIIFKDKTAQFPAGTSVDKIVDSLLANSAYFAKKLQSSTSRAGTPETLTQQTDQMKQLWRIITETKPIAFDPLRQNNAVEITIWIVEYNIGAVLANATQTGQTSNTVMAEQKRFNEYASKRILNKIYNYIFTGINDQVLNFDLNMNFSFAAALSRFGGYYINSTSSDPGIKKVNIDAQKNVEEQIAKILQFVNSAQPNTNVDAKIKEAQAAIQKADLTETTKARYTNLLKNYVKPGSPIDFRAIDQQIAAQGGIQADGTTSSLAKVAQRANTVANAGSLTSPIAPGVPAFISDINVNSPAAKQAAENYQNVSGGKLRPIVFAETNQDQNAGQGTEATNDPSRARLSSIFSTALYSTLDASLQYVKITIKGDPYWLFPGSISATQDSLIYKSSLNPQIAIAQIKEQPPSDIPPESAYANVYGSDNFIVIRFRTPSIYTQAGEPGAVGTQGTTRTIGQGGPLETVSTFSGIYRVITVISKFEGGKFTQELTCMLDPVINVNLDEIRTQIEAAIRNSAPIVPSVTVAPKPPAQITANTKTQPILSNTTNFPNGVTPNFPGLPSTMLGPITAGSSNIPSGQFQTVDQIVAQTIAGAKK
jgi:hypothetical protein